MNPMNIEPKVTNIVCGKLCGVGGETVCAVRRMLGIVGVHKVYASAIAGFLKRYQDFAIADAESRKAMRLFQARHPDFELPYDPSEV